MPTSYEVNHNITKNVFELKKQNKVKIRAAR